MSLDFLSQQFANLSVPIDLILIVVLDVRIHVLHCEERQVTNQVCQSGVAGTNRAQQLYCSWLRFYVPQNEQRPMDRIGKVRRMPTRQTALCLLALNMNGDSGYYPVIHSL